MIGCWALVEVSVMFALMRTSGENHRLVALQALLTDLYGVPVAVEGWERLGPWAVARVLLGGTGAARTVIVKWVRAGPAQVRSEPWRLCAELAALQFLSEDLGLALAPGLSPPTCRPGCSSWKTLRLVSPWTALSAVTAPRPIPACWPRSPGLAAS